MSFIHCHPYAGVEIDDCLMVEDDDMLFLSAGEDFVTPTLNESDRDPGAQNSPDRVKLPAIVGGYVVGKLLGRGAFGEVRVGEHQLTGERVALKFLRKNEILSIGAAERTINEIQCLTALRHQSIIRLQQHLESPQHVVLVFELMDGGDLKSYLHQRGLITSNGKLSTAVTEDEARMVLHQLVGGVSFAHNQHICHRDLKLENIL
jgi:serine/threonine protein kinase